MRLQDDLAAVLLLRYPDEVDVQTAQNCITTMIVILMGVSGSGKSTVGKSLAQSLKWQFLEGDALHSTANVAKMSRGTPLTDEDRWPWLQAIKADIDDLRAHGRSAVVTCSALKQSYRNILQTNATAEIQFVYLKLGADLLRSRLAQRQNHFMKAEMLKSQLDALEEPDSAIVVEVEQAMAIADIVHKIRRQLAL